MAGSIEPALVRHTTGSTNVRTKKLRLGKLCKQADRREMGDRRSEGNQSIDLSPFLIACDFQVACLSKVRFPEDSSPCVFVKQPHGRPAERVQPESIVIRSRMDSSGPPWTMILSFNSYQHHPSARSRKKAQPNQAISSTVMSF